MIELYYWTTPNGHKITIMLEELNAEYKIFPIHIGEGDQFSEKFLKISPNNRIPAMIDLSPKDSGKPISVFESGAILQYLGEKFGKFFSSEPRQRNEILQWLNWQMGGLGPMIGQNNHFNRFAPEKIPYAMKRYTDETDRLCGVLNKRLAEREFLADEYSIADIACYPWIVSYEFQKQNLSDFPCVKRWFLQIQERPAVIRAYRQVNSPEIVNRKKNVKG